MLIPLIDLKKISNLKGKLLLSHPNISDNRFSKSVIYITEHTKEGAEGFVINKSSAYTFPTLLSNISNINVDAPNLPQNVKHIKVLRGGPVNNDKIFILHSPDYTSEHTSKVTDSVSYTTNIEILEQIVKENPPKNISIFIGNCTWQPLQLEEEIKMDTWVVLSDQSNAVFNNNIDTLWTKIFQNLGITNTSSSYFQPINIKTTLQ